MIRHTQVQLKLASLAYLLATACLFSYSDKASAADNGKNWSFTESIKIAQKNDPWLTGNKHQQQAVEAMSLAVSSLPDPKISIGLANLPTDGFDFSQEGMTQLKVGITQMFPRGDSPYHKKSATTY